MADYSEKLLDQGQPMLVFKFNTNMPSTHRGGFVRGTAVEGEKVIEEHHRTDDTYSPYPLSSNSSVYSEIGAGSSQALLSKHYQKKNYYKKSSAGFLLPFTSHHHHHKDSQKNKMLQKEMNIMMATPTGLETSYDKKTSTVCLEVPDVPTKPKLIFGISQRAFLRQVTAAFVVSIGSLVVGFTSAYSSPALASMSHETSTIKITKQDASWIGSIMPLSALVGGVLGGPLIDSLGRKTTLLATAMPFITSFGLIGFANEISMIMIGRAIAGFAVGIMSLALPVYLGETAQREVRGTLGLLPTTLGNGGILVAFVGGMYMDWSQLALFGACIPIPFFVLMFLIPETPRWFILKNKRTKAEYALNWLRGRGADIVDELSSMEKSQNASNGNDFQMKDLFARRYLVPFSICIGLMFFQQFSGINAVIFYTVTIFKDAGSTIDSNICSIIVGLVNLLATLCANGLIDRLGRKILLYTSATLMSITLLTLGGFFYAKDNLEADVSEIGWLPLLAFVVFVVGFAIGFGPIPWLMMGEILPAKIRGTAASLVTGFNWSCTFIVTKTFVDLTSTLGSGITFWMFGAVCLVSFVFIWFAVPETKGKSLEEIESQFAEK